MRFSPVRTSQRIIRSLLRRCTNFITRPYAYIASLRHFNELSKQKVIKLNLGSGPVKGKDGWTTVDVHGSDIIWDLRNQLPLENNSVREIYSSHLLEHLSFIEIKALLGEMRRILSPSGTLKICVPDASKYINAYINRTFLRAGEALYGPAITDTASFIDQVNYIAYMGGEHKFMFDIQNLTSILNSAGFREVSERNFDNSIDSADRETDSMYVLAK